MIRSLKKLLLKFGYSVNKVAINDMTMYCELYSEDDIVNRRFYNVGAGLFTHPAWTNVDYASDWYKKNEVHINANLLECKPFPIDSATANAVYSSHTIEHITDEASQNIFNEAFRILKKGGFIRLTTPNIDLYYRTLMYNNRMFWKTDLDRYSIQKNMDLAKLKYPLNSASLKQIFLSSFASQCSQLHVVDSSAKMTDEDFDKIFETLKYEDALDYCKARINLDLQSTYPGNHINWWNSNKLFKMLKMAGFEDIYLSGFGQSMCPVLQNTVYFDNTHPAFSIYVEAKKIG